MFKSILFATIPHTGIRFFLKLIEESTGLKHHIMRGSTEGKPYRKYNLATCHLVPENWKLLNEYIRLHEPFLITLDRNKDEVIASYRRRGQDDGRIERAYKTSELFMQNYKPLVLSVDSDDREERLQMLSELIGHNLSTDWQPVGSKK